jgi:hypothetical protein
VAAPWQKHTRRGWRLDKPARAEKIDAVIALAMAVERAVAKPGAVEVLGFL